MANFLDFLSGPILPGTLMLLVSAVYFAKTKSSSLFERLVASAHGVLGVLYFLVAIWILRTGQTSASYLLPFTVAFIVPFASVGFSFWLFRGDRKIKWLHWLQIPNVLCLLSAFAVGCMAVTNDFL